MKNIKKKCQGTLGHSTSQLQGLIYACAYVTSENVSGTVQNERTGDHVSLRFCSTFVALAFFMECPIPGAFKATLPAFSVGFRLRVARPRVAGLFRGVGETSGNGQGLGVPSVPRRLPIRVSQTVKRVRIRARFSFFAPRQNLNALLSRTIKLSHGPIVVFSGNGSTGPAATTRPLRP